MKPATDFPVSSEQYFSFKIIWVWGGMWSVWCVCGVRVRVVCVCVCVCVGGGGWWWVVVVVGGGGGVIRGGGGEGGQNAQLFSDFFKNNLAWRYNGCKSVNFGTTS